MYCFLDRKIWLRDVSKNSPLSNTTYDVFKPGAAVLGNLYLTCLTVYNCPFLHYISLEKVLRYWLHINKTAIAWQ